MRVTVVGSGFVGQTTAMRLVERGLAEVVLIDIVEGLPQGLALDLRQSAPVVGFDPSVIGTNDYADTAGSDVVVITAGFPGSRDEPDGPARQERGDRSGVVERFVPGSPDAIIIVVTNPLDEMTFLAADVSGFPKERVMGMAGSWTRPASSLHRRGARRVAPGGRGDDARLHGESMVPLPRHATVDGKPLTELVDEATLERLYARTRDAGAEIVGLLKKGAYAPSASAARMVEAIAGRVDEPLPVCAWCTGQYGIDGVYVGVPVRLSPGGVTEIVELDLNEDELAALRAAAEGIRTKCADLATLYGHYASTLVPFLGGPTRTRGCRPRRARRRRTP